MIMVRQISEIFGIGHKLLPGGPLACLLKMSTDNKAIFVRKVYLIPSRGAHPNEYWYPWVKSTLEQAGFGVTILQLPDPDRPKKSAWMAALTPLVSEMDADTYLVGHSVGCQATLRLLDALPAGRMIGGTVLVGGWVSVPNWNGRTEAEKAVLNDWMNPPLVLREVAGKSKKFTAIFSDNDEFVPRENWAACEKELGAEVIVKHNFGHFEAKDLCELPEVTDSILVMSPAG